MHANTHCVSTLAQYITCMPQHTLHMRRMFPRHMEYSLQSNCLLTLWEVQPDEDAEEGPFYPYGVNISVHDLGAGGRMLCDLNDLRRHRARALCNP